MKVIRTRTVPTEERGGYRIRRLATEPLHPSPTNIGLYQTIIPKGSKVGEHAHEQLTELLLFLTPCQVKTDEGMLSFESGDFLILEPGEFHEIYAGDEEVRLMAFKLPNVVADRKER